MREISLHLLDLVQNSVTAGARLIEVSLVRETGGLLKMVILDDGRGMDKATLEAALSPFGTSRTIRKLGFGIPLTREQALRTGGSLTLESTPGKGTRLEAVFDTTHIDCPPLGSLADTLAGLVLANPDTPDFSLCLASDRGQEELDTRLLKQTLDPVPVNTPEVALWLRGKLEEITENCFGGIA